MNLWRFYINLDVWFFSKAGTVKTRDQRVESIYVISTKRKEVNQDKADSIRDDEGIKGQDTWK